MLRILGEPFDPKCLDIVELTVVYIVDVIEYVLMVCTKVASVNFECLYDRDVPCYQAASRCPTSNYSNIITNHLHQVRSITFGVS